MMIKLVTKHSKRIAGFIKSSYRRRLPDLSRGIAFFLAGFSLLNIAGQIRNTGFDANIWWIDFRPINPLLSQAFLIIASFFLLAYSLKPFMSQWRRKITIITTCIILVVTLSNILQFFILLFRKSIQSGFKIPFSVFVFLTFMIVLNGLINNEQRIKSGKSFLICFIAAALCLIIFPLAQMVCFGKTDYRRPADAVIVFGARVYSDGRPSDALKDRVRTACRIYHEGLVKYVIFSGGPGDGNIHETKAMKKMAMDLSVPESAILLDKDGINTRSTVSNSCELFRKMGIKKVLAVSHFYHLPRIKMSYQQKDFEVYTVPAKETYILSAMPKYIAREVIALWVYYLRPVIDW